MLTTAARTPTRGLHDGARAPLPLRRARPPRNAGLLALAVLASLALLPPAPAEASVTNLTQTGSTYTYRGETIANAFTTGGTTTDTYTLQSVILTFTTVANPEGEVDVSIYTESSGNPGTKVGSSLTGTAGTGNRTYTASSITLSGGTTYFMRLGPVGAGTIKRGLGVTANDGEDSTSTTGWSIANDAVVFGLGTWSNLGSDNSFRFTVNVTPVFTASAITTTSATLTLAHNTAGWWYKRTAPTAGTCMSRSATQTTLSPSELFPDRSYTYKAYSASGCMTANEIASVTFQTQQARIFTDVVTQTTASLSLANQTTAWWYKRTTPTGGTCSAQQSVARTWFQLSGLTPGTSYAWKVYTASGCADANAFATATFKTLSATLRAPSIARTSATLTFPTRGAAWWLKRTAPSAGTCTSQSATRTTVELTGLTEGSNTYKAYSASGCAGANEITSVTFTTTTDDPPDPPRKADPVQRVTYGSANTADRASVLLGPLTYTAVQGATLRAWVPSNLAAPGLCDVGSTVDFGWYKKVTNTSFTKVGLAWSERKTIIGGPGNRLRLMPGPYAHWMEVFNPEAGTYIALARCKKGGSVYSGGIHLMNDGDGHVIIQAVGMSPGNTAIGEEEFEQADPSPPGPVTNIVVTHNGTSLDVTWDAPAEATHYDVTYSGNGVNARAAWLRTGTSLNITCDVRTGYESQNCVSNSSSYTVGVRARNGVGASAWVNSAPAQPPSPPGPVTNLDVIHNGDSLVVTWDAPSRATHYDVTYRGNGANARAAWSHEGTSLTITCDVRTGYSNQNCVTDSATYTVSVRARNAAGAGAWTDSAPVTVTAPAQAAIWFATPGAGKLDLYVVRPARTTGYDVRTKTGGGSDCTAGTWGAAAAAAHSYVAEFAADRITLTGLQGDTEHCVQVRATNAANGAWSAAVTATPGLALLAVADATVAEPATGTANLDFTVTLAPASPAQVTVDYATGGGTATAGSDYTSTSGTLTFAAGETSKTVSVPVLPDAHDDGGETLTLTLSNASGATLSDATATGTITNDGSLQKQWLSRFGRTVAGQMVEALEGRFAVGPGTPSHLTIAGHRVDFSGDLAGVAPPEHEHRGDGEPYGMDLGELLLGSSFHFTAGEVSGAGAMTGWGKALAGSSSAQLPGGLSFTSDTTTGVLGMDFERDNLLVGFALSETAETGGAGFAPTGAEYALDGSLSLVTPYARFRAGERLSLWAMTGTGEGELSLGYGDAPRQRTDLALQVVAAGGRAELLRPDPEGGGFALALKTDAFFVRTESESVSTPGVGNLAGAVGDASRVRAVLEGSRAFALSGGGSVEPLLSLGLRHDGGDAETGTGVEMGAGLAWSDPSIGLTSDLRLYGLAAHEDASYDEWGVSGSLRIEPGTSGRGLSLSMTPTWGAQGQSGRIWDTQPSALVDEGGAVEQPGARLDTELGYGLSLSGGLTGTPYVGLGLGEARDYRLGWRLASGRWQSFSLGIEATRREGASDAAPEHGLGLRLDARF